MQIQKKILLKLSTTLHIVKSNILLLNSRDFFLMSTFLIGFCSRKCKKKSAHGLCNTIKRPGHIQISHLIYCMTLFTMVYCTTNIKQYKRHLQINCLSHRFAKLKRFVHQKQHHKTNEADSGIHCKACYTIAQLSLSRYSSFIGKHSYHMPAKLGCQTGPWCIRTLGLQ